MDKQDETNEYFEKDGKKIIDAMVLCGKKSHRFINRLLHTTFTLLKQDILGVN